MLGGLSCTKDTLQVVVLSIILCSDDGLICQCSPPRANHLLFVQTTEAWCVYTCELIDACLSAKCLIYKQQCFPCREKCEEQASLHLGCEVRWFQGRSTWSCLCFAAVCDVKIRQTNEKRLLICFYVWFQFRLYSRFEPGKCWFVVHLAGSAAREWWTRPCWCSKPSCYALFFFFFFWWGLLHGPQQGPDRMKEKTYKTGKRKTPA